MEKQIKTNLLTYLQTQGAIFKTLEEFGPQLGNRYCIEHPPIDESSELSYLNHICPRCEATNELTSIVNQLEDDKLIEKKESTLHNIPDIRITADGLDYLKNQTVFSKIKLTLFPAEKVSGFIWGCLTGACAMLLGQLALRYFNLLPK